MFEKAPLASIFVTFFAVGAASGALAAEPPYERIVGGDVEIAVDRALGDVLVIDGRIEIQGVVRGHLYAVDSEVVVRRTAVVLGSVTLTGGALHLEDGAVLPAKVDLYAAKLFGPRGEHADPKTPTVIAGGATTVALRATTVSTVSVALTKSILPFERVVPEDGRDIAQLRSWEPGLGLELGHFVEGAPELSIAGVKLPLKRAGVAGSFQRGYHGARGRALVTGVDLVDDAEAVKLFDKIVATAATDTRLSIGTALGHGAHRYFQARGRQIMLWTRGTWVFAVETRLDGENTTPFQDKQFSDQITGSLALGLRPSASQPEGAQR